MSKHRLVWTGDGALDLSQIIDDRGVPVQFTSKGQAVVVPSTVLAHPVIKRYLTAGLVAEALTETTAVAPAPARVQSTPPAPAPLKTTAPPKPALTAAEPVEIAKADPTIKMHVPVDQLFDIEPTPTPEPEPQDKTPDYKGSKKGRHGSK